jgi:hypothetical protein
MLARIHYLGGSLVFIQPVNPMDPGFGVGIGGGHPDQGLPGYGHPDQGLPGYGHPDQSLPGSGLRPSQLPSFPAPPHVQPGATLVMVRDPMGVWHWAVIPPGQPTPTPLPTPPPTAAPKA